MPDLSALSPALFLDRDGVIIENRRDYIRNWGDVAILPGALESLALVRSAPLKFVLVTNQSAVGRGLMPLSMAQEINSRLVRLIFQSGGRIDGVFMCPHAPQELCACRKPQPGLLLRAAQELSLDLHRSRLVGDALSDLKAGKAAGIERLALVRTGLGAEQEALAEARGLQPFQVFDSLADALPSLIIP